MGVCNAKPNKNHYHYEFVQKPIIETECIQNETIEPPSYYETINRIDNNKINKCKQKMIKFYSKRPYNYNDLKTLEFAKEISPESFHIALNILYNRKEGLNYPESVSIMNDIQILHNTINKSYYI